MGEFLPCTGRADRVGSTDQQFNLQNILPRALYYSAKPLAVRQPKLWSLTTTPAATPFLKKVQPCALAAEDSGAEGSTGSVLGGKRSASVISFPG